MTRNQRLWIIWLMITLPLGGVLVVLMVYGGNRTIFLIGRTSDAHHQIELACGACHTSPFGGREVMQDACVGCHATDLKLANDSHPKSKFTDPRNADRVAKLDARLCITCHREHNPDITNAMAVTLPTDYCFTCHADIAQDRPSHEGIAFDTCASSGCHNFHDNRALYEDFLEKHLDEPTILPEKLALFHDAKLGASRGAAKPLTREKADAPAALLADDAVLAAWAETAHADAGVNCSGCHVPRGADASAWIDKPDRTVCAGCHADEARTFVEGKHGMRLSDDLVVAEPALWGLIGKETLSPMRPELARLPMKQDAHGTELGCTTCHSAHAFDTRRAAVEPCAGCHDDQHTRAYFASPHYRLWQAELSGEKPQGSGVTCATCHMPRHEVTDASGSKIIVVTHNQNDNLRPNEKMARSVCTSCHGLQYTLDALADRQLIATNFTGAPRVHVESLDWVERRMRQRGLRP